MSSSSRPGPKLETAHAEPLFEGGEMGALVQSWDWSKTPLGPIEGWSLALRMMVKFLACQPVPFTFVVGAAIHHAV